MSVITLPSRMEDCLLARSLSPTSSLRSEHAANRLWIFVRSGVDAGFFAENGAPQRTHVFVGNSGSSGSSTRRFFGAGYNEFDSHDLYCCLKNRKTK